MSHHRKVNQRQAELLLDYMEQHGDLATGQIRSKEGYLSSSHKWSELAAALNAEGGQHSHRTAKEWNRFYNKYKSHMRNKIRKKVLSQHKVDGGPEDNAPLTPTEKKPCSIIGSNNFQTLPVQYDPRSINPENALSPHVNLDSIDIEAQYNNLAKPSPWNVELECYSEPPSTTQESMLKKCKPM